MLVEKYETHTWDQALRAGAQRRGQEARSLSAAISRAAWTRRVAGRRRFGLFAARATTTRHRPAGRKEEGSRGAGWRLDRAPCDVLAWGSQRPHMRLPGRLHPQASTNPPSSPRTAPRPAVAQAAGSCAEETLGLLV